MRYVAVVLLACASLCAQSLSLNIVGNGPIRAGNTIQIQATLSGTSAVSVAGWQATIRSTTGGTWTVAPGPASTAAGKSFTCSAMTDLFTCLDVGVNQNTIADGVVATYTLVIPANATPGQSSISLSSLLGATLSADPVTITAAPLNFTLASPLSPCDINSDGMTDVVDVTLEINQVLGLAACSSDLDADGKCTVVDVLRVVATVNGAGCRVGK